MMKLLSIFISIFIIIGMIYYWPKIIRFIDQDSCLDRGGIWLENQCKL
jgi:hypothetical protein